MWEGEGRRNEGSKTIADQLDVKGTADGGKELRGKGLHLQVYIQ